MSSEEKLWPAIIFPGFGWSSGQKIKQMQFLKRKFEKTYNLYRAGLQYCICKASYLQKNTAITFFPTDDSYLDIFQVLLYAIKGFIQKIS